MRKQIDQRGSCLKIKQQVDVPSFLNSNQPLILQMTHLFFINGKKSEENFCFMNFSLYSYASNRTGKIVLAKVIAMHMTNQYKILGLTHGPLSNIGCGPKTKKEKKR